MLPVLKYEDFHPFVRCVGKAQHLRQDVFHLAYDYRMLMICSGNGIIETDGKVHSTCKDEMYIISPGTRYRAVSGQGQTIIVINFDMTHSHSNIANPVLSVTENMFLKENIIEAFDLSLFFGENGCIKRTVPRECIDICTNILKIYTGMRTPADDIILSSLFSQVIYHATNEHRNKQKNTLAIDIYNFITENYANDLSLESTAEAFHIHPTYVNRLLNRHYGTSFRQLLLKSRFSRALYLIDNTDMPIKEIAPKVGFNDAQYFSNAFYKRFGYYPSAYRK